MLRLGAYPNHALVPCFAMDSKAIYLPRWHSFNDDLVFFQENFQIFYVLTQNKKEIRLLTPTNNQKKSRLALMRVIRELAMNQCLPNNGLFLHGSAFSVGGKGIIIAGSKGAGKTTLLIYALRYQASEYLSNDRVWVALQKGKVNFRGMPTIASILPSTLELFPDLKNSLLSSFFDSSLTENEARQLKIVPQPRKNGKYSLSPSQFCHLLQVTPVAEAQGWAILFPKVTQTTGKIELQQLSQPAASKRLTEALLGNYSQTNQAPVFTLQNNHFSPNQETINLLSQNIVSHLPCYECYLGTEAYQSSSNAKDFIDYLLNQTF
ncbi:MAG: hypothetical protein SAL07_20280 [Oscillatoria sp. PMC 1051.18]|nr:hypothetical protein [Oscillatoria sp. PMC 1050.18]MEC5032244.1 hypothetical protein [Oscillatoria sp. PMC 1051.18]